MWHFLPVNVAGKAQKINGRAYTLFREHLMAILPLYKTASGVSFTARDRIRRGEKGDTSESVVFQEKPHEYIRTFQWTAAYTQNRMGKNGIYYQGKEKRRVDRVE